MMVPLSVTEETIGQDIYDLSGNYFPWVALAKYRCRQVISVMITL